VLRTETPRDIFRQGTNTIRVFLLAIIFGGVVIVIAVVIWLRRSVLGRLTTLSSAVRQIGQSGDLDVRVPVSDHVEFGSLAESINEMLSALAESHDEQARQLDTRTQELIEESNMLRILINNMPERVYIRTHKGVF
jgi:nitrate/nitrite-specific signal transduction histidine kinase